MNTYRPEHFKLQELVGPEFYTRWGERSWEWLQVPSLMTIDAIRKRYGAVTINTWADGGQFHESGLRDFATATGAGYSQHKFGGAFDLKFGAIAPTEVFDELLAHPEYAPMLTTMEDARITKTWLHVDCRNHGRPGIWVVQP